MELFLIFMLSLSNSKAVQVHITDVKPKIDGIIESVWQKADSAYGFTQSEPYEMKPPSELTTVYLLQDGDNLYIAYRCLYRTHEPVANLRGNEDNVTLFLDTFCSKTTAYYFTVCASGTYDDGMILDDGRRTDNTWDGVWYRGAKIYTDRYEVEIKIPFKSIRYKEGFKKWGINFERYIVSNQETDYWTEVLQVEGNMISQYGELKDIVPSSEGYYFELYPEGYIRYNKEEGEDGKIEPKGSLNFKWDLTPQTTLYSTMYPDFAQIESDPFNLNLSKYEEWLDEHRPFFLEGQDIFRMSDLGEGKDFYSPLNIFYSRRIGKSIEEEPVQILSGLKVTSKLGDLNLGVFGAYTDSLRYSDEDTIIHELRRSFGAFRIKHRVFENSSIGLLFGGTMADRHNYNYALGIDGVYLSGLSQFIFQGAFSDKNGKTGWAFSSACFGFRRGSLFLGTMEVVQDSFDVDDIGYVPWIGMKKLMFACGPFRTYTEGFLSNIFIAPVAVIIKEPDSRGWSKLGSFVINPNFRNNWGFNFEVNLGLSFEEDVEYFRRGANLSVWGNGSTYNLNFGGNYFYGYNYDQEFLAYQGSNWFWMCYNAIPRINLSLSSNIWIEWDTLDAISGITMTATPRVDIKITRDMILGLFNELVMETPKTSFGKTEITSNRIGFLLSWNFSPKSWLYVAINDYREQDDNGNFKLKNSVGAVKLKYLIYF